MYDRLVAEISCHAASGPSYRIELCRVPGIFRGPSNKISSPSNVKNLITLRACKNISLARSHPVESITQSPHDRLPLETGVLPVEDVASICMPLQVLLLPNELHRFPNRLEDRRGDEVTNNPTHVFHPVEDKGPVLVGLDVAGCDEVRPQVARPPGFTFGRHVLGALAHQLEDGTYALRHRWVVVERTVKVEVLEKNEGCKSKAFGRTRGHIAGVSKMCPRRRRAWGVVWLEPRRKLRRSPLHQRMKSFLCLPPPHTEVCQADIESVVLPSPNIGTNVQDDPQELVRASAKALNFLGRPRYLGQPVRRAFVDDAFVNVVNQGCVCEDTVGRQVLSEHGWDRLIARTIMSQFHDSSSSLKMDQPSLITDGAGARLAGFIVRHIEHTQHKHNAKCFGRRERAMIVVGENSA